MSRRAILAISLLFALAGVGVTACGQRPAAPNFPAFGGDAKRGGIVIGQQECGSCHFIPNISDAHGQVGPPLNQFAERTMVAGLLPNTPPNLIRWLRDPQGVVPGNAMPNTNLSDQDARDVAAYLYTLR